MFRSCSTYSIFWAARFFCNEMCYLVGEVAQGLGAEFQSKFE